MELELEATRLQRVGDKQVAARAKQAAAEFKTVRSINQYKQWINGSDQMAKYQAIQELGWLNDHRAIPVLLEVFAAGQQNGAEKLRSRSITTIPVWSR